MSKASHAYLALSENAIDQIQKLGRDIAVARKRRHISMSEMAERMMVNPKTVQRLEEGIPRSRPRNCCHGPLGSWPSPASR